jgi:GNAT superfamily N-acetyltransferase
MKMNKIQIIELSERKELLNEAINYFWNCWGNNNNFPFYKDCIENSIHDPNDVPKFYLAMEGPKIIGTYALLINDLISRQDLKPWLACLFTDPELRGKGLAGMLLEHGLQQTRAMGYPKLYLYTDLVGFYEKKGWEHICNGFITNGDEHKIYCRET